MVKKIVKYSEATNILRLLNRKGVAEKARKESRNREIHYPPLSTFRWWARRTGSVNEAILEAAASYFGHDSLSILDPFAGGGTIPLVALMGGHRVQGQDINPWAVAGVRQMLTLPPSSDLQVAYSNLLGAAGPLLNDAYATIGAKEAPAELMHTFRVATSRCANCNADLRLFPYSLLTLKRRRETGIEDAILACPAGHTFNGHVRSVQPCPICSRETDPGANYTTRRIFTCPHCGSRCSISDHAKSENWGWEVVLVERAEGRTRSFDVATQREIDQAEQNWDPKRSLGSIPAGSETNVLLRHGFVHWEDLYPKRQRVVTETLLDLVPTSSDDPNVQSALRMAIIGTTEFAGHLCRWDRFYLKLNDATAGHRFNFSTFVPELNVVGVGSAGRGTLSRRVAAMCKASDWLVHQGLMSKVIRFETPKRKREAEQADAFIILGDSRLPAGPPGRFDIVLTDPPYHDDVQYGELSMFFRAWAELDVTELTGEATSCRTLGRNTAEGSYGKTLEQIFSECRRTLKPHGRLIFSYANSEPEAWVGLFSALQVAGFFAVSCVSVHSENETDFKKRNVKSHVEDLMMELSIMPNIVPGQAIERDRLDSFMQAVVDLYIHVGNLPDGWHAKAIKMLVDSQRS